MFKKSFFMLPIILMTSLLLTGVILGEEEFIELSPSHIIKMFSENNLEIQIAEITLDNAKLNYQKNMALIIMSESRYQKRQAELTLAQAENSYLHTTNSLYINIINKYLKLKQEKLDLNIKDNNLELAARKLAEVKNQVEAGHRGTFELLQQENEYNNALFSKEKALTDYQLLLRQFTTEIGLSQEEKIKILELKEPKLNNLSEEEILLLASENSFNLELRTRQAELAEIDLERAEASETPLLDLKIIENELKLALLHRKMVEEELYNAVKEQYYSLLQAFKNLELAKQNVEQALENKRIITSQRQAGLRTENDVLASQLNLLQAQYNRQISISNYYLALLNIQQIMGLEIGGAVDELLQTK